MAAADVLLAVSLRYCVVDAERSFDKKSCRRWLSRVIHRDDSLLPWPTILRNYVPKADQTETNLKVCTRLHFDKVGCGDFDAIFRWAIRSADRQARTIRGRLQNMHSLFEAHGSALLVIVSCTGPSFPLDTQSARTQLSQELRDRNLTKFDNKNR
jgi:hypothetical protein